MSNDVPERGDDGPSFVPIEMSPQVNELANALCKAQSEMSAAAKDANNPHFKRQYATLASVWEACRGPLTGNGLSVIQRPMADTLETILFHSSGQWIATTTPIFSDKTGRTAAQAYGSAVTYARRYALSAMVGIVQDDDDGEAAGPRPPATMPPVTTFLPEREPPPADIQAARFTIKGNPTPELKEAAYTVLIQMTPFAELGALAAELQASGLPPHTLSRLREQYTARKAKGA